MKLILSPNADLKPTMPPAPVEGYVGSAVLLDLVGIPSEIGNCTVSGVRVSAASPDNSIATAICAKETDGTILDGTFKVNVLLADPILVSPL